MEGFSEGLIVLAYVNSVTGSIYAELHEMSIVFGLLKIKCYPCMATYWKESCKFDTR